MGAHADKAIIQVRQGEIFKLPNDEHTFEEITCDDIAKFALAMYDHIHFFSLRRGLRMRFSRDLNGSGTQGLYITREADEEDPSPLVQVVFDRTYGENGEILYEADLIMDQRKDYEPTVNKGKHRFAACYATIRADWHSEEIMQYRSDIERLSKSPDTLRDWIEQALEMQVNCTSGYFCRKPVILNKNDLERFSIEGLTLEDLKARLKCSKCGKLGATVRVF